MKRVRKFDRYVGSLKDSISVVNKAICEGALLTKQEELDYFFKKGLCRDKKRIVKTQPEVLGYFYAEIFSEVHELRAGGYTNKDVVELAKHICFTGWTKGLSDCFRVHSYDSNGVLYMELYKGLNLIYTFEVNSIRTMSESLLALVAYIGTRKIQDQEYKEFAEMYLINIHKEVMLGELPKPYTYTGAAKTLRNHLRKSASVSSKSGKIIDFRAG